MATVQVKRETLKSIGNVQDWALKQRSAKDKKEVTVKSVKPRGIASKSTITIKPSPSPPSPSSTSPSLSSPFASPSVVATPPHPIIKEEVKEPIENGVHTPPAGSKVRRIYSREFLIKFKYSATPFPPGVQTPLDLINQYNKEFELKEQQRLALVENSASTTSSILPVPQPITSTITPAAPSTVEKKVKKIVKKADEKNTFKLRLANTDESLLCSPLFRATAKTPITTPSSSSINKGDDKENPVPVKSVPQRSLSITKKRHAVSPSPSSSSSSSVTSVKREKETKKVSPSVTLVAHTPSVDSFAVPIPVVPTITPSPVVAVDAPKPVDAVMTEDASKQDIVDVLSKKLKNALKETDTRRLAQRQKQIEYGKATSGYQDYCKQTAKSKRKREDPKTPNKYQVCSKRSWDGQIRKWRRMLHMYDPAELKEAQSKEGSGDDVDMIDGKEPFIFEITAADVLAEEKALLE